MDPRQKRTVPLRNAPPALTEWESPHPRSSSPWQPRVGTDMKPTGCGRVMRRSALYSRPLSRRGPAEPRPPRRPSSARPSFPERRKTSTPLSCTCTPTRAFRVNLKKKKKRQISRAVRLCRARSVLHCIPVVFFLYACFFLKACPFAERVRLTERGVSVCLGDCYACALCGKTTFFASGCERSLGTVARERRKKRFGSNKINERFCVSF